MQVYSTHGIEFPGGSPKIKGIKSAPHLDMNLTNPLHMSRTQTPSDAQRVTEGFASALTQALGRVEQMDINSQKLNMKAVYEPDSVEAHEIVLAAEKARFALNLTKTVTDGLVRTFRDLTNPR